MVTRVLDRAGNVVHDCAQLGCDVSWDGADRKTGKPVQGSSPPDSKVWRITGQTAKAR